MTLRDYDYDVLHVVDLMLDQPASSDPLFMGAGAIVQITVLVWERYTQGEGARHYRVGPVVRTDAVHMIARPQLALKPVLVTNSLKRLEREGLLWSHALQYWAVTVDGDQLLREREGDLVLDPDEVDAREFV